MYPTLTAAAAAAHTDDLVPAGFSGLRDRRHHGRRVRAPRGPLAFRTLGDLAILPSWPAG